MDRKALYEKVQGAMLEKQNGVPENRHCTGETGGWHMAKILIVEDEVKIARFVELELK